MAVCTARTAETTTTTTPSSTTSNDSCGCLRSCNRLPRSQIARTTSDRATAALRTCAFLRMIATGTIYKFRHFNDRLISDGRRHPARSGQRRDCDRDDILSVFSFRIAKLHRFGQLSQPGNSDDAATALTRGNSERSELAQKRKRSRGVRHGQN